MENDFAHGLCPVKTSMNNALPKDINCIRFLSLFLFESLEVLEDEKSPRESPLDQMVFNWNYKLPFHLTVAASGFQFVPKDIPVASALSMLISVRFSQQKKA